MLLLLSSSDGLLLKERSCLLNTLIEQVKVNHVLLDLWYGQIDQHTSDFWSVLVYELLNELENDASNRLLVVSILLGYCTQNWDGHRVERVSKRVV